MSQNATALYTARTRTSGGRDTGVARSSDGTLDLRLAAPGSERIGTNPEQLFAAGWSACLESAIALAADKRGMALAGKVTIDAEVDLHLAPDGYSLGARFSIAIPGIEQGVAQALVDEAHRLCPYSKATRGNIDVSIRLV